MVNQVGTGLAGIEYLGRGTWISGLLDSGTFSSDAWRILMLHIDKLGISYLC
jgi:hypothetical protein